MTDVVTPEEEQPSKPPPVEPPRPHPVRIVDDDDLRRSRLPVLVRWLLAYPHFIWLGLYALVAVIVATVNWIVTLVTVVAAYLLTPFTLHRLGDQAYGTWNLIASMTGYLGLLALGVRYFRVEFVGETPEEVGRTLAQYRLLLRGEITGARLWRELKPARKKSKSTSGPTRSSPPPRTALTKLPTTRL